MAGLEQSVRTLKQQVDKCKKDVAKSDAIIKVHACTLPPCETMQN